MHLRIQLYLTTTSIAYWGPAAATFTLVFIICLFIQPLWKSQDVYGIQVDVVLTLITGSFDVFVFLCMNAAHTLFDDGYLQQITFIICPLTWPFTGSIWPVLQSYGIEPARWFTMNRKQVMYEPTESNLLYILADPPRSRKLEQIAIRSYCSENLVFLQVYLGKFCFGAFFEYTDRGVSGLQPIDESASLPVRTPATLLPPTILSNEFQRKLYQRFIVKDCHDELNLPAWISRPLHTVMENGGEFPAGLWPPVFNEVMKMVIENCFPQLNSTDHEFHSDITTQKHTNVVSHVSERAAKISK